MHNLEQDTNRLSIQIRPGRLNTKTTEIYIHISQSDYNKSNNPFDDFDLNDIGICILTSACIGQFNA